MTSLQPQAEQPRLRRAIYIHVSDLTSAYDIDHAKLEQELSRVRADREIASAKVPMEGEVEENLSSSPGSGPSAEIDSAFPQKRLQPPRGGYNLCVLVGKVQVVVDKKRVDGSRVRLAEVEVGDETGSVSLRARDEQIDILQEVSEREGAVVLRNCMLELYQGRHIRLAVTKWGKLNTYPDQVASTPPPPSKMNKDRNFSLIDLSLVASEMVIEQRESGNMLVRHVTPASKSAPTNRQNQQQQQPQQQQQQHQNRRMGRGDRRPLRSRNSNVNTPMHPVMHYSEGAIPNPIRFPGIHGFSGAYEPLDVQAYSFPHQQQESLTSTQQQQQLILHQQFEMQQRQLHQMYHDQQERHRQMISGSETSQLQQSMIQGSSARDYSVTTYAGGADHHPQILIPMSMAQAHSHMGSISSTTDHPDHYSGQDIGRTMMAVVPPRQERVEVHTKVQKPRKGPMHPASVTAQVADNRRSGSGVGSGMQDSPGRMNPQAATFAPSYMNPQYTPSIGHAAIPGHLTTYYDPSSVPQGSHSSNLRSSTQDKSYRQATGKATGNRAAVMDRKEIDKADKKSSNK